MANGQKNTYIQLSRTHNEVLKNGWAVTTVTTITKLETSLELGIKFNLEMERMNVSMLFYGTTEEGRFIFTGNLKYSSNELADRDDTFLADIIRLLDDSGCDLVGMNQDGNLSYSYSCILNSDEFSAYISLTNLIGVGETLDKMIQSETTRRPLVPTPLNSLDQLDSIYRQPYLVFNSNLKVLKVNEHFEEIIGFRFKNNNCPLAILGPEMAELIISLKDQLAKRGLASAEKSFCADDYIVYCLELPTEQEKYFLVLLSKLID